MNGTEPVNILLVDDQPAKLLSYEVILRELGENLIKAGSAREALEHLLKTDVAVVLVDVCMPELDGFELASIIREHPRYQKTAIIFVSGVHLTELDRLKGYEVGAVDYVPVPVVPEILRAKVGVFAELYRKTRQLERLNHELERRVAERTAELEASTARLQESEERLRLALGLAQRADRLKDEFLATLAHELRNPLSSINNAVQVLRRDGLAGPELQWSREVIDRQVGHLTRLIDDLLDVNRITRGTLELRTGEAELSQILGEAVESSRPLIDRFGHRLTLSLPDEPIHLEADQIRLVQVFTNLLNNATKYTPQGGHISLTAERDGSELRVRVRDTGIGVAPDQLPRLFEMFYQADRSLERAQGGLGIGLTLVQRLVELHGGRVEAHSDGIGYGTELVVHLPVSTRPAGAGSPEELSGDAAERGGRRILVVDDNRDSADGLAMLLELGGDEVRTAYDGLAAVEAAAQFRPEAVLMDIGMPMLNGYDAARRIREQPWGRDVLLIALTGWGQDEDRRLSLEAGFDVHLTKPVDHRALTKLLAGRLAGAGPADDAR
jgi:signal transduction histidine kinase